MKFDLAKFREQRLKREEARREKARGTKVDISILREKFAKKVSKTDGCWWWTAATKYRNGYGGIRYEGKIIPAHRASWLIHKGEIPSGLLVCHTCDNPPCVNPDHLFLGTYADNAQDACKKGRVKIPKGRVFKPGNVPKNSRITRDRALQIRDQIGTYKGSLKSFAETLGLPYQLLKDIKAGRAYKDVRP